MKKTLVALFLAGAVTTPALAASPSFNYVQGSYVDADFLDGFGVSLVREITDEFVFLGDFNYLSGNLYELNADVYTIQVGFGYRHMLTEQTAFVVGPHLIHANADIKLNFGSQSYSESDSETGFGAIASLRHMLHEQVELSGGLQYYNIASESDVDAFIGARFYVNPRFSVGANILFDGADTLTVGAAYHF